MEKLALDIRDRFNSINAAKYLGFAPYTLRQSRCTGLLAGVATPHYLKIGRKIIYERHELGNWLSQFEPQQNIAAGV